MKSLQLQGDRASFTRKTTDIFAHDALKRQGAIQGKGRDDS
jgi:hypothetical protein